MTATKSQITALIATFAERRSAERFVDELKRAGFKEDEIGLIAPPDDADAVKGGALAGAITGGALGAVAGIAATAFVPGLGPALVAGQLAGILGGVAAGATAGGLVGTLIALGVSEEEARKHEQEFLVGRTLVIVQALGRGGDALAILNRLNGSETPGLPAAGLVRDGFAQGRAQSV